MEVDRIHRNPSTTSTTLSRELLICFTSRLSSSSSSMKISKSILSPSRSRDPPISLSTSLSRRLRTNGSIKGGQASPMFPTGGKKGRCAFENPEPSSPKVTCIGQVRVKSKKKKQQGKKLRSLSRRNSSGGGGGEVSFRRLEQSRDGFSQNQNQNMGSSYLQSQQSIQELMPQRNQRWVHLPLTICEALRTIGSEFSCLFPCKSREKEDRAAAGAARSGGEGNAGQSSCGTVFRWLVAVQDGEGGRNGGRDIELVVGEIDDDNEEGRRREFMEREGRNSRRRHVFDDLEIVDNRIHLKEEGGGDEEGRVSICIPPKNALLLMRCRSDPVQMEALTSKLWESPAPIKDVIDEEEQEEEITEKVDYESEFKDCEVELKEEKGFMLDEEQENLGCEEEESNLENEKEKENQEAIFEVNEHVEEEIEELGEEIDDENMFLDCLFEEFVDEQVIENVQDPIQEEEDAHAETTMEDNGEEPMLEELAEFEAKEESTEAEEPQDQNFEDANEKLTYETSKLQEEDESNESESESIMRETEKENKVAAAGALPDCLLLMMCEPKLSMEVSKETWVCSTDFIRRQQQPQIVREHKTEPQTLSQVKPIAVAVVKSDNVPPAVMAYRERNPVLYQPPRSSCCLPAPAAAEASMGTMIEQKLVSAMGCEPFGLTRCKSEPMRNASKLVPETCFWKNRKLEPLRPAAYGVSAAGLGF